MAILGSRRGSTENLALPLMIVAFLAVGGFLYWLSVSAKSAEVVIVEETPDEGSGASAILSLQDFLVNPEGQIDAIVEITDARIASRLGTQAFWIGSDAAPYLVRLSPSLADAGIEILVESVVNIVGSVFIMSDSVLTSWDEQGVFSNEGDRIVAEFATSFLEATAIDGVTGSVDAEEGAEEGVEEGVEEGAETGNEPG